MNSKGIYLMILLVVVPLIACTEPNGTTEEAEIRQVVEGFGKRLQLVSLQSPSASREMRDQYSPLVSPALLEAWTNDVSKASDALSQAHGLNG
ncbi:MAG TPA: hypothetical protein VNO14_01905 [Blastocatellia bacterium]|nr:hypothetical protein [Blastocatellia bacterium]